ncbi:TMEM175 family protein [Compostimonas suwonensis]|uniref:Putative membrane protein n=1 Tax=Compostimonas suwonensis TaxID=1048394 RepID=A0A2M9BZ85_9MICO|nr:TMEM175 family protein [Compostimonas suwonensis]PJJ63399.1 putative membrane protein [Compostimonas suwonensis]
MRRRRPSLDDRPISTRRLEAFTDGVFAIAATLLVLDLSVDTLTGVTDDAQLADALSDMLPTFASFVISFLVLGMFWGIHVRQFEYIRKVDRTLITLNTFRLLFVVLIPFTTSVNADFQSELLGRLLLPVNVLVVSAIGAFQWFYATRDRDLVPSVDEAELRENRTGAFAAIFIAVLVVIASIWIGSFAFFLFFLNPVADAFVARRAERRAPPADHLPAEGTPRPEA